MNAPKRRKNRSPRTVNQVRIIAGKWRSRRLDFPAAEGLRPTGDRIREMLFNWLSPVLAGARCLDAFAGSGALGFEALSRGAEAVHFVDNNPLACSALRDNRDKLGAAEAHIEQADVLDWLAATDAGPFDIVFLDPPFAENLHSRCLESIARAGIAADGALLYLESPTDHPPAPTPPWRAIRQKRTGSVLCQLWQADN